MNKVILLGRVGQTPEVKVVGQSQVCKFSLATSESYKKNDEKITETTWHNLVFWGKQCEILKQWVHKGDQLMVEGKISIRKYTDKDGVDHWSNEVVCDRFEFIASIKKEDKPDNKEGQAVKGKIHTGAMSDINELPGNVADENVPDDLSDLLF
jgi:single-strand DNA-binding protein